MLYLTIWKFKLVETCYIIATISINKWKLIRLCPFWLQLYFNGLSPLKIFCLKKIIFFVDIELFRQLSNNGITPFIMEDKVRQTLENLFQSLRDKGLDPLIVDQSPVNLTNPLIE